MALVLADRVLETTPVTGTGNATLIGAQANYQPFSVIGNGSTTYYTIVDNTNNEWEVGIGTYTLTGNFISRDTVLSSSNGGALVYFGSGDKDIFLDLPSEAVTLTPGDVFGPASAIADNFAAFNMTTGKLIKDSGYNASSFATAAQGTLADTAIQPGDLGTAAYLDAGSANGVATLDAGGKVPTSQIPQMGDLNYQGTWNASTNTPTLTSSSGTKGFYYVVSVAGSTNLNGITDWKVGDWAVFNGSVWEKIDNTDAVTSVNGFTGTVVLTTTDIAEGTNEYFTTAKARTSISAGTGISYDNGTGVVTNAAPDQTVILTGGTAISTSGTYPSFTITNTAPDQVVSLTAGTGINTSGTYPSFTITNSAPDQVVSITGAGGAVVTGTYPAFTVTTPSGTVTSVSGTAPIASTGGATPAISISQSTTSTDGYLSSTDWNTFNNKQPAGSYLTAVTASTPLSGSGTVGSPLIISQATTSVNGYLSSTDWNTFNGKYSTGGALGTPSSGTLTNCTGYTYANLSGTVPTWNQNTTGTAANVTGTVAIANGGTGETTRQAAMDALAGATTSGQYLRGNGSDVVMSAIQAGDVPTLNQDTTGKSAKTDALNSATTVVNVSSSAAPSSGQVLTATSSTAATWQTPASGAIPSGGIIIWSGSAAAIPSGWLLCNGASGTPDLRNRFIVGAGSTYAVGATGGSADAIVVSHNHTASSTFTGSALGTHTHTATSTVTDPGHFHDLPGNTSSGSIRQTQIGVNATPIVATSSSKVTGITVGTTNSSESAGTPAGSVSTTNTATGSSGTNANLPPYYALCYIMKS